MADGMPNFDPTAKIGKFPIWVWAVVLAGGVLLFTWFSRNKSGSSDSGLVEVGDDLPEVSGGSLGSSDTATGDALNDLGSAMNDWFGALNDTLAQNVDISGATISSGVAAAPAGGKGKKSGPSWEQRAVNYLTASGYGGVASQRSIQKYLAGKPLTAKQKERVNVALAGVGLKKNAPKIKAAKPKKTIKIKKAPPKPKPKPKKKKNKSALKR